MFYLAIKSILLFSLSFKAHTAGLYKKETHLKSVKTSSFYLPFKYYALILTEKQLLRKRENNI